MAASAQRNYRFPVPLLERLESAVPMRQRSAFVRDAVEEALDRRGVPVPERMASRVERAGTRVVNAPVLGTLVRVEDSSRFAAGTVGVSESGERFRVREVEDDLLAVDRGVEGTKALRLDPGDWVCAADDLDASPAGDDHHRSAGVGGDGNGPVGKEPPPTAAGGPAAPVAVDGARAVSAAPVPDVVGRAPVAPAASDSSALEDPQSFDPVELAPALAGITGDPALVWRGRIEQGRVTVAGRPFKAQTLDRGQLEYVELDGERVV